MRLLHIVVLSAILLVSGFCSLAYQVVWIREFRLIFGGTTGAMAAVLAVFMGGLGLGGAVLGRRVERCADPLRLYAWIELGITITAGLSPLLLAWVRGVYFSTGGETGLGYGMATLLRTGMTIMVIGLPCVLMGGTLPAAVKHLQHDQDGDRKLSGWLYGINVFGALVGVAVTTFVILEHLGSRSSLWLAAGLNLVIALSAFSLCCVRLVRSGSEPADETPEVATNESRPAPAAGWCYGAAFTTGLTFFLMELVWYRVSIPLTGGSVYALGMVLMTALLGLAVGGGIYSVAGRRMGRRPGAFAFLSALQIVVLLVPYLMGDWFAWLVASGVRDALGND